MTQFSEDRLVSGLYWCSWMPAEAASDHVVIVHGLAEHIGRYAHVAERLNQAGFGVHGLDHVGHGKSPGTRVLVERFSDYSDGVSELLDTLLGSRGVNRVHLIGHSMGGLIASHFALQSPERLHSLILSGPAIVADPPPPAWQKLVVRLLSKVSPGSGVLALDSNAISRDQAVVQAYLDDPLVYNGKVTARLAAELFDAMELLQARGKSLELPMLLMHGMADTLTAPKGSELLHRLAASTDKTLRQFPGCYHEIFNEPEQDQILTELVSWLDTHRAG
ncbi:MAG: lysophospholipase [Pseudomonadota bacterium]